MKTRTVKYHPEKKNFELILNAPDGAGMSEVYALWQDDEDYGQYSYKTTGNELDVLSNNQA